MLIFPNFKIASQLGSEYTYAEGIPKDVITPTTCESRQWFSKNYKGLKNTPQLTITSDKNIIYLMFWDSLKE